MSNLGGRIRHKGKEASAYSFSLGLTVSQISQIQSADFITLLSCWSNSFEIRNIERVLQNEIALQNSQLVCRQAIDQRTLSCCIIGTDWSFKCSSTYQRALSITVLCMALVELPLISSWIKNETMLQFSLAPLQVNIIALLGKNILIQCDKKFEFVECVIEIDASH